MRWETLQDNWGCLQNRGSTETGRQGLIWKRTLQNVRKNFFQNFNQTHYGRSRPCKNWQTPIRRIFQNSATLERLGGFEHIWAQNDRNKKYYRFGTLHDGSKVIRGHLIFRVRRTSIPSCGSWTKPEFFFKISRKVQFLTGFPTVCRTLTYPIFSGNGSQKTKFRRSLAIPEVLVNSKPHYWLQWAHFDGKCS